MKNPGTIYLIPSTLAPEATGTIPAHVRDTIKNLDFFLVENERSARRYISSLKLGIAIETLRFEILDKRSTFEALFDIMMPLKTDGINCGVISEAGCPGIADPGALAVRVAHELNVRVVPLVGPSSILLALMGSGFNGQSFTFQGYLPIEKEQRVRRIRELESLVHKTGATQIFMETPYRNVALFESLLQTCRPQSMLCVAAGLTSPSEFIYTLSIANWKKTEVKIHKVPTMFLLGI